MRITTKGKKASFEFPHVIGQTTNLPPIEQGVEKDKPFLKDEGNSLQNTKK